MKNVDSNHGYKPIYQKLPTWYAQFDQENRDCLVELVCHGFLFAAYFGAGSSSNSPMEYEQIADICDIADMFLQLQTKQLQ